MPLPLTAEGAEVILQGRVDGQVTLNTLWFQKVGSAIAPSDVQALGIIVGNWWTSSIAPLISNRWQAETVHAQDQSVGFGAVFEASLGPVPGGVDEEPTPNNVAAVVSFSGGSAARFSRGRNFVPALPNSLVDINTIDSSLINDLVNAYKQLLPGQSFDPTPFVWCVVSHFSGIDPVTGDPIPRGAGLVTVITSVVMKTPFVRSMRTREVGKGK